MKKTALLLALYMVLLVCFTACSTDSDGSLGPKNKAESTKITMSDDERVSYYDGLASPDDIPHIEATDSSALYKIKGDYDLVDENIFDELINVFNPVYPRLYSKYGKYNNEINMPVITFYFDATFMGDAPASVVGNTNTININAKWFNNNPDKVTVILYYIANTVLDYNNSAPDWLKSSVNYYIAAEHSAYGYELTGKYNGGDYQNGGQTGADFLHWISVKYSVDIVAQVNKMLNTSLWFEGEFWSQTTGRTLEQLWAEYKVS